MRQLSKEMRIRVVLYVTTIVVSLLGVFGYYMYLRHTLPEVKYTSADWQTADEFKDFTMSSDGTLTSITTDPWIRMIFPEGEIPIKVVDITVSNQSREDIRSSIYTVPESEFSRFDQKINVGLNRYYFEITTPGLRFDLTNSEGDAIQIESIVINSKKAMFSVVLKKLLSLYIVCLLFAFVCYEFAFQILYRKEKDYQLMVKMGLLVVLMGMVLLAIKGHMLSVTQQPYVMGAMFAVEAMMFIVMFYKTNPRKVIAIHAILVGIAEYCFVEIVYDIDYYKQNYQIQPRMIIWNIALIMFVSLFVYLITNRYYVGIVFSAVLTGVLGLVNHFYYTFRDDPFELVYVLQAATAADVIENYTLEFGFVIIFAILILVMTVFCGSIYKKMKCVSRERQAIVVFTAFILMSAMTYSPYLSWWRMNRTAAKNGYVGSFVIYAREMLKSPIPEGYTTKSAQELIDKYKDDSKEKEKGKKEDLPNVIVIMNESWSDLPTVYGFETDVDGQPFYHGLEGDNVIKGNLLVSIRGAGTANSEYELLTGNSLQYVKSGSMPYVSDIRNNQESLAWVLKNYGYQTTSFHPMRGANYNRTNVYPFLGFDRYIAIEDPLEYFETFRSDNEYMSDKADFQNLISMYEEQKDNGPVFLFNVTMQNHGDFAMTENALDVTVRPTDADIESVQMNEYLSLMHETDSALEFLTDYFSEQEEDTIILMFGDHQPKLDASIISALENLSYNNGIVSPELNGYLTPYVIWANFDIDTSLQRDVISPGFLRATLMKAAGIPLDAYDEFLWDAQQELAAVNICGYIDGDGTYYDTDAESEEMNETLYNYQVLQYANMYDKKKISYEDFCK